MSPTIQLKASRTHLVLGGESRLGFVIIYGMNLSYFNKNTKRKGVAKRAYPLSPLWVVESGLWLVCEDEDADDNDDDEDELDGCCATIC